MNEEKSEGYTSYLYGITKCPYYKHTTENLNWWYGWHLAEEEDVQNHEEWR